MFESRSATREHLSVQEGLPVGDRRSGRLDKRYALKQHVHTHHAYTPLEPLLRLSQPPLGNSILAYNSVK